jgi:ribosome-binding factor A
MDSIRQQKISKILREDISALIQKELKHFCEKSLVTVTNVRVTPDLGIARVYLSIFATEDKNGILDNFTRNVSEIRFLLGKRIRHQVRHVPELQFYIDDSLDFIERIDKALKS